MESSRLRNRKAWSATHTLTADGLAERMPAAYESAALPLSYTARVSGDSNSRTNARAKARCEAGGLRSRHAEARGPG